MPKTFQKNYPPIANTNKVILNISCMEDFSATTENIKETLQTIIDQARSKQDDADFVYGVESLLKKYSKIDIIETCRDALKALTVVEPNSYLSIGLSENLLTLSKKLFEMQYPDDINDNTEKESLNIIRNIFSHETNYGLPYQNKAIDILLSYATNTLDPFFSVEATNQALEITKDPARKKIIAHNLFKQCEGAAGFSLDFTMLYLRKAIEEVTEDTKQYAVLLWQECIQEISTTNAEQAHSYATNDMEETNVPLLRDTAKVEINRMQQEAAKAKRIQLNLVKT